MTLTAYTQELMMRLQKLLSVSEDEIVQRGITETATARIVDLRQRAGELTNRYGSMTALEETIKKSGVTPDDHSMYTDLIEWQAVRHEIVHLTQFLESV